MATRLVRFPLAYGAGSEDDLREGGVLGVAPAQAYESGDGYYVTADEKSYLLTDPALEVEHEVGQVYRFHLPGSNEPTTYRLVPSGSGVVDFQTLEIVMPVADEPGYLGDTVISDVLADEESASRALLGTIIEASAIPGPPGDTGPPGTTDYNELDNKPDLSVLAEKGELESEADTRASADEDNATAAQAAQAAADEATTALGGKAAQVDLVSEAAFRAAADELKADRADLATLVRFRDTAGHEIIGGVVTITVDTVTGQIADIVFEGV